MDKELAKELIKYFKSLGIEVYTNTKARGHQGFFLKNRIDISKNTREDRIIPTLLHEFAHFIHNKIEPDMAKTGGTLEVVFKTKEIEKKNNFPFSIFNFPFEEELLQVTNYIDENSLCHRFKARKEQLKKKIKTLELIIKKEYPHFMRSKKFKEFDKYIKKSKAKYLLRYDRVKFITPFLRHEEFFSIDNIEKDFPDISEAFCAYIRLKSSQKKQSRISARINSLEKYYSKPTELFARFVEGLYINDAKIFRLAPITYERFFELLENGYYFELKNVFQMLQNNKTLATF